MIQSVVSRMAVVSGVTLALLSLPVILLSSGEIGMFKKQSVATTACSSTRKPLIGRNKTKFGYR